MTDAATETFKPPSGMVKDVRELLATLPGISTKETGGFLRPTVFEITGAPQDVAEATARVNNVAHEWWSQEAW